MREVRAVRGPFLQPTTLSRNAFKPSSNTLYTHGLIHAQTSDSHSATVGIVGGRRRRGGEGAAPMVVVTGAGGDRESDGGKATARRMDAQSRCKA